MSIDLEQFHQVFFEESLEGLDIMESSLMELDPEAIDSETINAIFRSAHSIKGGSATFGFTDVTEFTHVLETLLDEVRDEKRGLSSGDIDLLLKSVDCMREMLAMAQAGEPGVTDNSESLKAAFEDILSNNTSTGAAAEKSASDDTSPATDAGAHTYHIDFKPEAQLFLSGNDPARIFKALNELGECRVTCDTSALPAFSSLDSEKSYLAWNIELVSEKDIDAVKEVFEWVEDDCELSIETGAKASESTTTSETAAGWQIRFVPGLEIMKTGNDPLRIIRSLKELGDLKLQVGMERLPDVVSLDAESCYLNWDMTLTGVSVTEDAIKEVFEWVVDDSDLEISSLSHALPEVPENTPLAASASHPSAVADKATNAAPVAKKTPSKPAAKKVAAETSSIRVGIDKVDNLINMVGELVITQSMLGQLSSQLELERVPNLVEGLSQLEQNTRELQETVMKIRMLPISFVFSRFPRMVRDLGQSLNKSVELELLGETTELDKTVMEKIGDPLVHLVRNSVDHGIELPDERSAIGKDPTGKVTLNAFHQSGNVVIEIIDDGKGLDREKIVEKAIEKGLVQQRDVESWSNEQVFDLIFQPGFSTASVVSDVSGRGVGMDVVKRNIQALNGVIEIKSEKNKGSKITIKLPLTLAILDGQLVRVGENTYVFPLVSIVESMQCRSEFVNRVAGGYDVFKLRDDYVPIISLHKVFDVIPDSTEMDDSLLVVVESDGEKIGILVDDLLGQQQVVIKSLEQNYRRVKGVSGATILGDGTVALILDIPGIINLSTDNHGLDARALGDIISTHDMASSEHSQSLGARA
jgi:two-component system chemotaxis sensor kinase CheA